MKVKIDKHVLILAESEPRAVHEIKTDGHRLVTVKIMAALEAGDWLTLHRLADELKEIASRGMHHDSNQKAKNMAAFAMGNHREPEPR